jgi:hypothetical protein
VRTPRKKKSGSKGLAGATKPMVSPGFSLGGRMGLLFKGSMFKQVSKVQRYPVPRFWVRRFVGFVLLVALVLLVVSNQTN